jgi:hypothetical protein
MCDQAGRWDFDRLSTWIQAEEAEDLAEGSLQDDDEVRGPTSQQHHHGV